MKLRTEAGEREAWVKAAGLGGYLTLSDFIRDAVNAAAKRTKFGASVDETWNTPPNVLELLAFLGPIGLDPCSNPGSIVPALVAWMLERDGDSLLRSWAGHGLVYVNPPYGDALEEWSAKLLEQAAAGVEIAALVPARVDTQWFDALCERFDCATLRGRLRFLNAKGERDGNGALFPSAIFYAGPQRDAFRRELRPASTMVIPARLAA